MSRNKKPRKAYARRSVFREAGSMPGAAYPDANVAKRMS